MNYQECMYYTVMSILLLVAGVCMWVYCADYWSSRNPVWQTWPSLAAVSLLYYANFPRLLQQFQSRLVWSTKLVEY